MSSFFIHLLIPPMNVSNHEVHTLLKYIKIISTHGRVLCDFFLNLVLFMLFVCVKWVWSITHPLEGRDAWVKQLVGLTHVVEKFSHVWRWCWCVNGVWSSWFLAILGRYKEVYEEGKTLLSLERAWYLWEDVNICDSWIVYYPNGESPPSPYILILW